MYTTFSILEYSSSFEQTEFILDIYSLIKYIITKFSLFKHREWSVEKQLHTRPITESSRPRLPDG